MKPVRKGARTVASIDARVLLELEQGTQESANLVEGIALNMAKLLANVAPSVSENSINLELGIVQRMAQAGAVLRKHQLDKATHTSDTVRGWAAFAIGQDDSIKPSARLKAIRPFAADSHFGVREWAWMAVRGIIVADPLSSIQTLLPWTLDKDPNIRRFATEATRPRGVWAASIPLLRKEPQHGLTILNALRMDQERYVEDSVANWLNDAAKDQADWVRELLIEWQSIGVSTRLIKRAGRSLKV